MQTITSTNKLKEAIQELRRKQIVEGEMLKEQFAFTVERVRPALVLKSFGTNVVSTRVAGNILNATAGLIAGYISKRIVIGSSGSRMRILMGNVMQLGVLGLLTKNPSLVKSLMKKLMTRFMKKKDIS